MEALEITKYMFNQDHFSQWLGIEIVDVKPDYCLLKMPIRQEMINGLKTVHGGVIFSFADSALAFSGNNNGDAAVALNCVINFSKAVRLGEVLHAESIQIASTRKTAIYDIKITNQDKEMVASFRGTVYKVGKKVKEL